MLNYTIDNRDGLYSFQNISICFLSQANKNRIAVKFVDSWLFKFSVHLNQHEHGQNL